MSSSSQIHRRFVGTLKRMNENSEVVSWKRVYSDHEFIIGRDRNRCHYCINEPTVSNKHVRIYTVIYDEDSPDEIPPLVYAEDLSRNGTYWNGTLIGKGNGGFLLSDRDILKINAKTYFIFEAAPFDTQNDLMDKVQRKELEDFKSTYDVTDRILGSGAHGKVFMTINRRTGTQLACKMIDLRPFRPCFRSSPNGLEVPAAAKNVDCKLQLRKHIAWSERQKKEDRLDFHLEKYYREVEILASIKHPNIIGLEKVYLTDNTMYIFQDLVTAGDLFSYLEYKNGKLLEVEAAVIIRQILIALDYLHNLDIVHRDLKPDNILMTSLAAGARIVLTDFGAARLVNDTGRRMCSLVGTEGYAAPEMTCQPKFTRPQKGYTKAVDLWSLGCISAILLTGHSPFADRETYRFSEQLAQDCDLTVLESSPDWVRVRSKPKAFVKRLLVLDEAKRLTANEALKDPWFSNDVYQTDLKELYQRTVKHWRHRIPQLPVLEFLGAESVRLLPCSQNLLEKDRKGRRHGGRKPVDPPYKPFARNMYAILLPQRSSGARMMSEEVRSAINDFWTPKPPASLVATVAGKFNFPTKTPPSSRQEIGSTRTSNLLAQENTNSVLRDPESKRKSFRPYLLCLPKGKPADMKSISPIQSAQNVPLSSDKPKTEWDSLQNVNETRSPSTESMVGFSQQPDRKNRAVLLTSISPVHGALPEDKSSVDRSIEIGDQPLGDISEGNDRWKESTCDHVTSQRNGPVQPLDLPGSDKQSASTVIPGPGSIVPCFLSDMASEQDSAVADRSSGSNLPTDGAKPKLKRKSSSLFTRDLIQASNVRRRQHKGSIFDLYDEEEDLYTVTTKDRNSAKRQRICSHRPQLYSDKSNENRPAVTGSDTSFRLSGAHLGSPVETDNGLSLKDKMYFPRC